MHSTPTARASKAAVAVLAVASAVVLMADVGGAQIYTPTPPPQNVLVLSTNFPEPGGAFTAQGCGFSPGAPIEVTLAGATLASITAGSDGCGFASLVAPTDPGTYTVCFTGLTPGGTVQQICDSITVRAAAAAPIPAGRLPFTGSQNLFKLVVGGMLLVAVGGLVLVFSRRRAEEY